jgi:hypothetical protein
MSTPRRTTGCPASGITEQQYAAPAFTYSRPRRFSTQISTQSGNAAEPRQRISWSQAPTGVADRNTLAASQADSAGSIPVTRSKAKAQVRIDIRKDALPLTGRLARCWAISGPLTRWRVLLGRGSSQKTRVAVRHGLPVGLRPRLELWVRNCEHTSHVLSRGLANARITARRPA